MKKVIFNFLVLLLCSLLNVNSFALGTVSRSCAGAGAQESISVDWGFKNYLLWTASEHYRNSVKLHTINTVKVDANGNPITDGWELTWRSYAGHLGSEFWYGVVVGHHYKNEAGIVSFLGNSIATDCNLGEWGGK